MVSSFYRQLPLLRVTFFKGHFFAAMLFWQFMAGPASALPAGDLSPANHSLQDLNVTNVTAFADAMIPQAMRKGKIPGAVFVVVLDGEVICEKAYGVTDLETQAPVSTQKTLFRVASISKILTAASALQLVHAGRLDLHRDVNDYLTRFQITPAFDKPVTLFNLLTHTGGFDESEFGYAARSRTNKLSLRDYLMRHQPARVRPPGLFSVYDNYGFALAGYLVQKASGVPFTDYVRKRILEPLKMEHSSFSPDAPMRSKLATGYMLDNDKLIAYSQNYVNITPAAGLCTTAADMADFLIALLANRRPDGTKMFSNCVISGLENQQFAANPEVPGRCYGFNRVLLAGRSALQQPGQWPGFNSVLVLFPTQHCGLFLAYNLCDYEHLERRISREFAKTFVAEEPSPSAFNEAAPVLSAKNLEWLSGSYVSERYSHRAPKLKMPDEIEVTRLSDGNLEIDGQPYREIEPLVFQAIQTNSSAPIASGRRVAFSMSDQDAVIHLITQNRVFRQTSWFNSRQGRQTVMQIVTITLLSYVIFCVTVALMVPEFAGIRQKPYQPVIQQSENLKLSAMAKGTALAACILALWFEASYALAQLQIKPFAGFYGFPAPLHKLIWALPVLLVLSAALIIISIVVWWKRLWNPLHRIHYTLFTIALVVFTYIFYARHLVSIG